MQYIYNTTRIELPRRSILTLGKFDGFHRGHQKLISYAVNAREADEQMVVFTFSTSPQNFMTGRTGEALAVGTERVRLAERLGVDVLIEYPFTDAVRHMDAADFVKNILVGQLALKEIVVGPDCRFGYKGSGGLALLRELSESCEYRVTVLDKAMYRGEVISSSRIRDCLSQGQIEEANAMLGYSYGICGEIVHGRQLGRTMGLPTINQNPPENQMMPLAGVYFAEVFLDGKHYYGAANVGKKPTIVGERKTNVETYILDFDRDVYGKQARVNFLRFIRPEIRFDSIQALQAQIERDVAACRSFV